jgi:hypothetical protein
MALQLSPDLDALLLELRQTYIGQPQAQNAPPPMQQPQQQQQMQPQPMLQTRTPDLPQAAPLLTKMPTQQPSVTAALSGLRPGFQMQEPDVMGQGQMQAGNPAGGQNQLLAQRLQQFMGQGSGMNAQYANALDKQQAEQAAQAKADQPSGWQSALGVLGSSIPAFASTAAGSSAISSGLGSLGAAASMHPYVAAGLGLGALGYGGYKAYNAYNQPQQKAA